MVVIGSIPGEVNAAFFFPAIYIIALGTGGIKPNVSTMGADQFDDRYSRDRKEKESFFNWFYWSINLGSMISYTVIAYICQYGIPQLGGADWGFFVGYLIPAIFMGSFVVHCSDIPDNIDLFLRRCNLCFRARNPEIPSSATSRLCVSEIAQGESLPSLLPALTL